ncbi:MAG: filamentous hemagglutinin N-terminal domain-containing protein, partial [Solimonas sp.]
MTRYAMTRYAKTRLAAAVALMLPAIALAGPSGGTVVSGTATIGGQGGQTVVTQTSNNAVVNWNSFSVGSEESVRFNQPNASSAILNRVTGGDASNILGNISSNGRVFLVNSNGIVFGRNATINVGSLIASTLDISDADFNAGKYAFKQGSKAPAGIVNEGTIIAGSGGIDTRVAAGGGNVVLLADHVSNSGYIEANLGRV